MPSGYRKGLIRGTILAFNPLDLNALAPQYGSELGHHQQQEEYATMSRIIGMIFEGLIQYTFLGVILALFLMLILLILLSERNRVMAFIPIEPLRDKFDQLCELSDDLDQPHLAKNPLGSAMWLTRLIWLGVMAAGGLMILWIMIMVIRG